MTPNGEAVLLMPTPPIRSAGPVATWVTAAGWARALGRMFGNATLITPAGELSAEAAEALVASPTSSTPHRRVWSRLRTRVPEQAFTLRKDLRDLSRGVTFLRHGARTTGGLRLVWQHHELFQNAGFLLARRAGVPLVQFVDAPIAWEGARWGTTRPWRRPLELLGERPQLRVADVIACVSDDVVDACVELGAPRHRCIVTPCSVEVTRYASDPAKRQQVREDLSIRTDDVVVGWMGSFRRFHGVEVLLDAAEIASRRGCRIKLVFIGDGLERRNVEAAAKAKDIHAIFCGMIEQSRIPEHLAALDVAIVTAPPGESFHYSPLKLKEYLAAGCAVVSARAGEMASELSDNVNTLFYKPGDASSLGEQLIRLSADPELRARLGVNGARTVASKWTWDNQVDRLVEKLRSLGWTP